MAGDERKSTVEVYPRAHAIAPGDGTDPAQMRLDPAPPPLGCFHLAIATDRSPDEILAIGAREGWRAVRCSRGGFFDVIELWIENGVLIEVLTAEMQRDYKTRISMETWRRPRSTTAATTPA
jgi:hypothetical protein